MSTTSADPAAGSAPLDTDTTTTFVMSRPTYRLHAIGADARFDTAAAASAALAARSHSHVVGALPFDSRRPAALLSPSLVDQASTRPRPTGALPAVSVTGTVPAPDEHIRRVRAALAVLGDDSVDLAKVVLARTLLLRADSPIDPLVLLGRLIEADHEHNGFLVDLSSAGSPYLDRLLIGSSPELLVRRRGSQIVCHPLAGSAPRSPHEATDRRNGETLAASAKDQHEHAFVVDALAGALEPLCSGLEVPRVPELTSTPAMWHLGSTISGEIRDPAVTALDLAVALHPTPAVCGTPTDTAREHILAHEEDRGFYAGAVGWCDAAGDGEWLVSIRCAELDADRRTVRASAGGGIVVDSDPDQELAETSAKFRTILSALGVTDVR